ncbi:MAG TPA: ergothioneine biosynthesis protein EgtB [Gemmatimonadaceae bacterium]|jgi:iron(II)-dependent oxidoreductase
MMTAIATHPTATRKAVAPLLEEARTRTLMLVDGLSDEDLHRQHDPLMSPIIWDLGHIAHFEELWLTRNLDGPIEFSEMPGTYNPFEHPRSTRASLSLPSLEDMRRLMEDIRSDVLERLETADFDSDNPLLRDGYVYNMVLQHEYQHNETILQTLQLKLGEPYHPPMRRELPRSVSSAELVGRYVTIPEGDYAIGTNDTSRAYDNERPLHRVQVHAFNIAAAPVTNGEFAEFIRAGGYSDERVWSAAGRTWLAESGAARPRYWDGDESGWTVREMDDVSPLDPLNPVCHVCYHEAEAFARWADARLPTEIEWEIAASATPNGDKNAFPWGDVPCTPDLANVDQLAFGTAPVGAYSANVSAFGCHGMIGDVWEWTSSNFSGYPGFQSFPYREYSAEFFGHEYKVLRGGSWATRPGAIRNTFRNWDLPIRRQIFSGFRLARDA